MARCISWGRSTFLTSTAVTLTPHGLVCRSMIRVSKQAEAERERRAKVINAEGEFQAAAKLAEAAEVLSRHPIAVQLRYLQTMREVASERNITTFFPLPLDLFTPLLRAFSAAEPPES
jgi:regulator of protease activity HflC (stomatin/prohibitin superfamily)